MFRLKILSVSMCCYSTRSVPSCHGFQHSIKLRAQPPMYMELLENKSKQCLRLPKLPMNQTQRDEFIRLMTVELVPI